MIINEFYHIWVLWSSWLCNQRHLYEVLFPYAKDIAERSKVNIDLWDLYSQCLIRVNISIVRKKIRKRRLFKKVQAFSEEKVLRCLLGVFWYAQ